MGGDLGALFGPGGPLAGLDEEEEGEGGGEEGGPGLEALLSQMPPELLRDLPPELKGAGCPVQ